MSRQYLDPRVEDEISLKDIVDFIVESWKAILATGIMGIISAIGYIFITPNQYEATAQIQMAQIQMAQIVVKNNNANALGINVEEPNLLIARMKLPSTYDQVAIVACGYEGGVNAAQSLSNMANFSLFKGTQMIELKVKGFSREQAMQCAESIFRIVKDTQKAIAKPIIDEAKSKLVKYSQRLQEAQLFIAKADKSGSSISAAYLLTHDEVRYLRDEMIRLNDLISYANTSQTKLISPIYSPENKVSPKRAIALIVGLFAGLFFGVLYMLGQRGYRAYKAANN
jgi:LPS O-antigen subunit length determinant protein (WzzB/FepE family)